MSGSIPAMYAMAERIANHRSMTASDLHDALSPLGAGLMVRAMTCVGAEAHCNSRAADDGGHLRRQDRQGRGAIAGTKPDARSAGAISMDCRRFPAPGARSQARANHRRG